jgi:hypothetical protein
MPFLVDVAGPQQPVSATPSLAPGALRRTSTIDTHPAGVGGSDVQLRGRDVVAREWGALDVLDHVALHAHLTDRVIDDIGSNAIDDRLAELKGNRVGPGFRSTVARVLPVETARASLLHLLLDDWAGAALVSGYSQQFEDAIRGAEQQLPVSVTNNLADICAGFDQEASMITYAQRTGFIPSVRGPLAPPLDGAHHDGEPLRPHGMRRYRRMDLLPDGVTTARFDAHFRDSHVDGDGTETILHEYTVAGVVELQSRTIASVEATVRVLPWQECPDAIGSASRIRGMALSDLRRRIKGELVGTSTCTHLNDTLRCLGDLDALLEARSGLDDV